MNRSVMLAQMKDSVPHSQHWWPLGLEGRGHVCLGVGAVGPVAGGVHRDQTVHPEQRPAPAQVSISRANT